MVPNFKAPFSAFTSGDNNPASFAIAQHYEARDAVVKRLVDLHNDDFDINDKKLFFNILDSYGLLDDGFEIDADIDYIIKEVNKRIV
jgi:hypothetical protein